MRHVAIARMPPRRLALVYARAACSSRSPTRRCTTSCARLVRAHAPNTPRRRGHEAGADQLDRRGRGRRPRADRRRARRRRVARAAAARRRGHIELGARRRASSTTVALQQAAEKNPSADDEAGRAQHDAAQLARAGRPRGSGSTHHRGCMFGPCSAHVGEELGARAEVVRASRRAGRPCRALRAATGTLPSTPGRRGRCSRGGSPRCARARCAAARSGTLNVRWCGPAPWRATKRARKSLRSVAHGSSSSMLMPSPVGVADPHLHRAEADRLAAEDDGAAELRRSGSAARPTVSAAASATWSRSYRSTACTWLRSVGRDGIAPAGSGEDARRATQPRPSDDETADRVEEVVVGGDHDHGRP